MGRERVLRGLLRLGAASRRWRDAPNSALTESERALVAEVSSAVDEACDATPRDITADQLIASGWPARVSPLARRALDLMLERGRFDEEREEPEPSSPIPWP